MAALNALDLLTAMPPVTVQGLADRPEGMTHAAFSLLCAAEAFENAVDGRFKNLAEALFITARNLYEEIKEQSGLWNHALVWDTAAVEVRFEEFESILLCLNEFYDEFAAYNLESDNCWQNLATCHQCFKIALVKKLRRPL